MAERLGPIPVVGSTADGKLNSSRTRQSALDCLVAFFQDLASLDVLAKPNGNSLYRPARQ